MISKNSMSVQTKQKEVKVASVLLVVVPSHQEITESRLQNLLEIAYASVIVIPRTSAIQVGVHISQQTISLGLSFS